MKQIILLSTIFAITLYCFLPYNANAEFYEYKDSSGIAHYTDNFSNVPEEYRNQIKINEDVKSKNNTDNVEKQVLRKTAEKDSENIKSTHFSGDLGGFKKRKADLDREYENIMKAQKALEDFKTTLKTDTDYKTYEKRYKNLKKEIQQYSDKRIAFKNDLDNFNRKRALETLKKLEGGKK